MLLKIRQSLAYRLPSIYRLILHYRNTSTPSKPISNIVVLMMTGKNHIDLTRISVLSIAKTWSYLPQLIISNDGSLSNEKIRKSLKFWKGSIKIENWENSADYHRKKHRKSIIKYANKDAFGKKLAIVLHYSEKHPVLWIDSDILFFKDFIDFIPKNSLGTICGGSEDCIRAYHDITLSKLKNNLYSLGNFNAGLLFVSGEGIYEEFKLEQIIEELHPEFDFLTEQTIFAHIASKSRGILWDKETVKNFTCDNQEIKPMSTKNLVARHYTSNVRHLFWRDAFFKT